MLPFHYLPRAKTLLSPVSDDSGPLGRFFYFDSVTQLKIGYHRVWSDNDHTLKFSEAVFMVESAPSLKSLVLQLDVQEDCRRQLRSTYSRLLVKIEEKPKKET